MTVTSLFVGVGFVAGGHPEPGLMCSMSRSGTTSRNPRATAALVWGLAIITPCYHGGLVHHLVIYVETGIRERHGDLSILTQTLRADGHGMLG